MLTTALSTIFVLGVLIFVHELGHFITAKMVGIKVEKFSLGFPPRMIGKIIGDTDYCISWIPLGGYVKMAGMIDESLDGTIKGEPWEFASKSVWQRLIVISAGSVMNLVTAIAIFALLLYFTGLSEAVGTRVGQLISGKPAEQIGLQPGDEITAIDSEPISTWQELTNIIHNKPNVEIDLEWRRDGKTFSAKVTPELQEDSNIGLIGIGPKTEHRDAGLFESVRYGFTATYTFAKFVLGSLRMIITGKQSFRDAVGGPIAIADMAGQSARQGFETLIFFTAILSINLAIINMFPFPVLDGGHLVLLLIEAIRRKPLPIKTTLVIQKVGMAFLLALIIFIFFNDITRYVNN